MVWAWRMAQVEHANGISYMKVRHWQFSCSLVSDTDKEGEDAVGEKGQHENGSLMKDLLDEVREEATRVNRLSEEAQTLKDFA